MFLILGAGYTGSRVARLLRNAGHNVGFTRTSAQEGGILFDAQVGDFSQVLNLIQRDTIILHSIPTLHTSTGLTEITPQLTGALLSNPPKRVVYLSTTGVYGETAEVDEYTPPSPHTEREDLRVLAEAAVQQGSWSSLVLRPAAIYGPNRGIHAAMRAGTFRLPDNSTNYVSRIHVDDLAAQAYAALLSDLEGAYPVADEEPCTSLEAARFCSQLLKLPLPPSAPAASLGETRRADRRVNGSAVRQLLHVPLRYPSYKVGFPACLAAEMS